ncbi:hypothetical protein J3F84DRAFT_67347 [Trichoderma pleuroticola]
MLVDSSCAFSRHLGLGLILLCSVCPMSLNYWFHLVQSMTCRCASLNVYGVLFGLAAYAVCLRRSLCSFPGWRFVFVFSFFSSSSFPSSFLSSLFSLLFVYLAGFPLSFPSDQKTLSTACAFDLDADIESHVGSDDTLVSSGLTRPQAVPGRSQVGFGAGIKSPAAGGDWSGYLGAAKQLSPLDSALSLFVFSVFLPSRSPVAPPCYFFFPLVPS